MVVNVTKISEKMKNKSLLNIEKKHYRIRGNLIRGIRGNIIRGNCYFKKLGFFITESIRNFFLLCLYLKSSLSTYKKYEKYKK